MSLLRDQEQAALAELHGEGSGLLLRYRELLDTDPDAPWTAVLAELVEARRGRIGQLGELAVRRGNPPSAMNLELSQLHTAGDRIFSVLVGARGVLHRLVDSESGWLQRIRSKQGLAWKAAERELLSELESDAMRGLKALQAIDAAS